MSDQVEGHIEMVSPAGLQWVRKDRVEAQLEKDWTIYKPVKKSKKKTETASTKSKTIED